MTDFDVATDFLYEAGRPELAAMARVVEWLDRHPGAQPADLVGMACVLLDRAGLRDAAAAIAEASLRRTALMPGRFPDRYHPIEFRPTRAGPSEPVPCPTCRWRDPGGPAGPGGLPRPAVGARLVLMWQATVRTDGGHAGPMLHVGYCPECRTWYLA